METNDEEIEKAVNLKTGEETTYKTVWKEKKDPADGHTFYERWIEHNGHILHPAAFYRRYASTEEN